jgi:hypothetical protein
MTLSPYIKKYLPIFLGVVLAVVIVPQIFPLDYVSAQNNPTLPGGPGAQKEVANASGNSGNQWCGFSPNPFTWATCAVVLLSYLINLFVGGIFLTLGAWLAQNALSLSAHVMELPMIQVGFGVSLSIANLGFVLGIIAIAVATILRIESYGMKQILWKLILMAILVNFSMGIAGTIVGFSNSLANYFMDRASPTVGVPIPGQWEKGNTFKFVEAITTGLSPQIAYKAPILEADGIADVSSWTGLTGLVIAVSSFFFTGIFLAVIAFFFFALAILFLIRFVFLGILLILMPLAWMMWVFPLFKANWDKWWHHFIRWCFFAPIAIFFIYLAVLSTQQDAGKQFFTKYGQSQSVAGLRTTSATNSVARLTNSNTGLLNAIAQMFVLSGLLFGGLFAANSLGIVGASNIMGAAKAGGKALGGFATRRVGGMGARFATKTAPAPLPANAGGFARLGHKVATLAHTAKTAAADTGIGKRLGDFAVTSGLAEKMSAYGEKTDPESIQKMKDLRRKGWQLKKDAGAMAPIAEYESAAIEAEKNARQHPLGSLEQKRFSDEAVEALKKATEEAGKISDATLKANVQKLLSQKKVGDTKKTMEGDSKKSFEDANKLAKANPTLVASLTEAILSGAGIMGGHGISDKAWAELKKSLHKDHDEGHGEAPPAAPAGGASGHGGGAPAPGAHGATTHP